MLPRLYLVIGSLLVFGYAVSEMAGWEAANPVQVTAAPPPGTTVVSNGSRWGGGRSAVFVHGYSSTYRGSPTVTGPTGGK